MNKFYYNNKKTVLEKKSDILVIYPRVEHVEVWMW